MSNGRRKKTDQQQEQEQQQQRRQQQRYWHVPASGEQPGIKEDNGVGTNCGKRKFICAANLMPWGHVLLEGDPRTEQIL